MLLHQISVRRIADGISREIAMDTAVNYVCVEVTTTMFASSKSVLLFLLFVLFVNVHAQSTGGLQIVNTASAPGPVNCVLQFSANNYLFGIGSQLISTSSPQNFSTSNSLANLGGNNNITCLANGGGTSFFYVAMPGSSVYMYDFSTGKSSQPVNAGGQTCLDSVFDSGSDTLWLAAGQAWVSCYGLMAGTPACASFKTGGNQQSYAVTIDTDRKEVWCVGGGGIVRKTPLSNYQLSPAEITTTTLAGNIYSAMYYPQRRVVLLGTDLGIAFVMNTTTFSLESVTFLSYSILSSVIVDPNANVIFWGALSTINQTARILRSNGDTFDAFAVSDYFPVPSVPPNLTPSNVLIPIALDSSANAMWWASGNNVYQFQLTNCSIYSCQTCSVDYSYCGFCYSELKCTRQSDCSSLWTPPNAIECPVLLAIVPNMAPSSGGTTVTITGTSFLDNNGATLNPQQTACMFDSSSAQATSVTLTTVQCVAPPHSPGTVQVTVYYNGARYDVGEPLQFQYYDCSETSFQNCSESSCLQVPSCGWCYDTMSCTSSANCTGFWQQSCPVAVAVPDSVSIRGNKTIFINIFPYLPNASYLCQFGDLGSSSAVKINQTTLECVTPPFNLSTTPSVEVTLEIYAAVNSNNFRLFATVPNFLIYDCISFNTYCAACTDQFETPPRTLECSFCFNQSSPQCVYTDSLPPNCGITNGTCPSITSIVPMTRYYGLPPILLNVTGQFTLDSTTNNLALLCAWDVNGTQPQNVTQAVNVAVSSLLCLSPIPSVVGTHELSIWINRSNSISPWTGSYPFFIYNCSSSPCLSCIDPIYKPDCYWCNTDLSCKYSNMSCAVIDPLSMINDTNLCPYLQAVYPSNDTLAGGTLIQLLGNFYFSSLVNISSISCDFTLTVTPVSTVFYNDTQVTCISPSSQFAGESDVFIEVNNVAYTNSLNFTYYDCTSLPNNADCTSCLTYPRCVWCFPSNLCSQNCSSHDIVLNDPLQCPRLYSVVPDVAWWLGNETLTVYGAGFDDDFNYRCNFGGDRTTPAQFLSESNITCMTPTVRSFIGNTTFSVLVQGTQPFVNTSLSFEFYWCGNVVVGPCYSDCVQRGSQCGWCLRTQTCSYYGDCSQTGDVWLHECITIIPSINYGSVMTNNETISITFVPPLYQVGLNITPSTTKRAKEQAPTLACEFGSNIQPAVVLDSNTIQCTVAQSYVEQTVNLTVLYNGYPLASPVSFTYVSCASISNCQDCIAHQFCGWCSSTKTCVISLYCDQQSWSNKLCVVIDTIALAVSLVVAGVALAAGVVLLIWLLRWRRKKRGLVVQIEEPDYVQVAFSGDLNLKYRITAPDKYKELEEILMKKEDRTFVNCLVNVTNATEQELVAKSLLFLAHYRGESAEMIQYFLITELSQWKDANTILRHNSIASKMFKFYSKLVGTRYLFFTLARVINELNAIAASKAENQSENAEKGASLLAVDMELDPNKVDNESVDIDLHKYQLALACQKIFSAIRSNHDLVPDEFRILFARMEATILERFDDETVYKAISGLFFLRFICPAITAPHFYGLLKENPNNIAQRQLVLIAKVLQNLANMTKDVTKEKFMQELREFTERNIPKLKQFYLVLLNPQNRGKVEAQLKLKVPEEVRLNSLAALHDHIAKTCERLHQEFKKLPNPEKVEEMEAILQKILDTYGQKGPRKLKQPKTQPKPQTHKDQTNE